VSLAKIPSASKIAILAAPLFANKTILLRILSEKRRRTLRTRNEIEDVQRKDAHLSSKLGYLV
jgi:hypothetical protein